ncbi:hypothetical protein C8R48DRAFT_675227 [Suillus tomentosus]|nr:hypothetical protein C8R48DRAFT_676237 [Suillus tomentosus]KAG1855906.1 hypothetical protein C8R48DRAFT_675227 [Suillus tomentosus]
MTRSKGSEQGFSIQTDKDGTWYGGSEKLKRPRKWADGLRTTWTSARNIRKIRNTYPAPTRVLQQDMVQRIRKARKASEMGGRPSDDSYKHAEPSEDRKCVREFQENQILTFIAPELGLIANL